MPLSLPRALRERGGAIRPSSDKDSERPEFNEQLEALRIVRVRGGRTAACAAVSLPQALDAPGRWKGPLV